MNTKLHTMSTRHFIDKIPPTVNKKRLTRACKVCSDTTKAQTGVKQYKCNIWCWTLCSWVLPNISCKIEILFINYKLEKIINFVFLIQYEFILYILILYIIVLYILYKLYTEWSKVAVQLTERNILYVNETFIYSHTYIHKKLKTYIDYNYTLQNLETVLKVVPFMLMQRWQHLTLLINTSYFNQLMFWDIPYVWHYLR